MTDTSRKPLPTEPIDVTDARFLAEHGMLGQELIAHERQRQIHYEGWLKDHDDNHPNGELADAGAYYAMTRIAEVGIMQVADDSGAPETVVWPWHKAWNKKSKHSRLKQLAIAGALIAAEIDRLARAGETIPGDILPDDVILIQGSREGDDE